MNQLLLHGALMPVLAWGYGQGACAVENILTIRVANGPFSGTYTPSTEAIICMRAHCCLRAKVEKSRSTARPDGISLHMEAICNDVEEL